MPAWRSSNRITGAYKLWFASQQSSLNDALPLHRVRAHAHSLPSCLPEPQQTRQRPMRKNSMRCSLFAGRARYGLIPRRQQPQAARAGERNRSVPLCEPIPFWPDPTKARRTPRRRQPLPQPQPGRSCRSRALPLRSDSRVDTVLKALPVDAAQLLPALQRFRESAEGDNYELIQQVSRQAERAFVERTRSSSPRACWAARSLKDYRRTSIPAREPGREAAEGRRRLPGSGVSS